MATIKTHAITSYTTLTVTATESQVDVANNRSYISTSMTISGSSYKAASLTAGLSGCSDRSGSWSGSGTVLSGGFWVTHNSDGTGTATVGFWMNTTKGNSMSYGTGSLTLTTIPRASTPSVSSNIIIPNVEKSEANKYTIYTNRASDSFTHTITVTIKSDGKGDSISAQTVTVGTAKGVGASVTFIPTVALYQSFRYSKTVSGYVTCTTYKDGTQIGSAKTCNITFSTKDNDGTDLTGATITETNSNITAHGSKASNITIQTISKKKIEIQSVAHNYAHTVSVTCNGVALTQDSSDATKWSGNLSNLTSGEFKFVSTDSRGWTNTTTVTQTYAKYSAPQITSMALTRTTNTSSTGSFKLTANFTSTKIAGVTQTLKTSYIRAVDGTWGAVDEVSQSTSGNVLTVTRNYDGSTANNSLYYTKTYQAKITITDSWGGTCTQTCSLGIGTTPLWIGKTDAMVGGSLSVGSTLEVGSANSGTITNVSNSYGTIQNATWRRMGRLVVFQLEYKTTATLPAYATVTIAKGLPAPSVTCRCNGAFVDENLGKGFVEIDTSGNIKLYHRLSSTVSSGQLYRIYGATYIQ